MKLFWKQADPLPLAETLPLLPPERAAQIARCRDPRQQRLSAAAGLLLREQLGPEAQLRRTATGKPYLPGGPELSLSHGGALATLLLADAPCGVDVEPIGRTASPAVRARVLRPEERADGRAFAWLWTRKEAVMKLDGRGLALDPRSFSVLGDTLLLDGRSIRLTTQIVCGHFLSCAKRIP